MNEVDIKELIKNGDIKEGAQKIKVPIPKVNGSAYDGQTYMIPIKYLHYNDQNGRIGTAISEYEAKNGSINEQDFEAYNDAIEKMIVEDDKAKMAILKTDIGKKGQEIPGYVLNDGRVIDGNRRFTACRLLAKESTLERDQYFEAVIIDDLDADRIDDKKILKKLELKIQFGRLSREDYDPIDRAIDVYKTVKVDHLMTNAAYGSYANMKSGEVDKKLYEAELVVEFLKYVNADPQNYALAKQMSLDGPLQELVPQYKKYIRESPQKNDILSAVFAKLLQLRTKSADKDFKQEFRPIVKNVLLSNLGQGFVSDMTASSDVLVDTLAETPTTDVTDLYKKINSSEEAVSAISAAKTVTDNYVRKAADAADKKRPIKLADDALSKLDNIDRVVFGALSASEKAKLLNCLTIIGKTISDMKQELE